MSQSIKDGDLVVVVGRKRCGCIGCVGSIFVFAGAISDVIGKCTECDAVTFPRGTLVAVQSDGYIEASRLQRIPPLGDLEGVLAQGEIRNPITLKKVVA